MPLANVSSPVWNLGGVHVAQQLKDPWFPQVAVAAWLGFDSWPQNLHMPWVQPVF